MNQYETEDSGCHAFTGGRSYGELLEAMRDWFAILALKNKAIETIIFSEPDDDTGLIEAYVYYSFMPEAAEKKLKEIASEASEMRVKLPDNSEN